MHAAQPYAVQHADTPCLYAVLSMCPRQQARDPSGSMAHSVLQPLLSEMGARLACADSLEAASLGNPLGQTSTHIPLLPTPTPALLSARADCLLGGELVFTDFRTCLLTLHGSGQWLLSDRGLNA
eukprot:scaffold96870_cov21-Tisochrysis_lutea.AAC.4